MAKRQKVDKEEEFVEFGEYILGLHDKNKARVQAGTKEEIAAYERKGALYKDWAGEISGIIDQCSHDAKGTNSFSYGFMERSAVILGPLWVGYSIAGIIKGTMEGDKLKLGLSSGLLALGVLTTTAGATYLGVKGKHKAIMREVEKEWAAFHNIPEYVEQFMRVNNIIGFDEGDITWVRPNGTKVLRTVAGSINWKAEKSKTDEASV